jgi:hypothetical protein
MNASQSLSVSSILRLTAIAFLAGVVITSLVVGHLPSSRRTILGSSTVRAGDGACSLSSLGGAFSWTFRRPIIRLSR